MFFGVKNAESGVVKNFLFMLRTANCCSDPLLLLTVKSLPLFPWISKELDEMLGGGAVELLTSETLKVDIKELRS